MTKYRVDELDGELLDMAVARAEGIEGYVADVYGPGSFSRSLAAGGAIIEREGIATWRAGESWRAAVPDEPEHGYYHPGNEIIDCGGSDGISGPTAIVAAMRAWVSFKLGPVVDL